MSFSFTTTPSPYGAARTGLLTTPHGTLETPAFVFCATKGAIKGLTMEEMRTCQTQIVLGNTFHLMLSPGSKRVRQWGGLARMSGWQGPTLTDSGGYQIFSMGFGSVAEEIKGNRHFASAQSRVKISEEGALFTSAVNGDRILLTPERSIEIQEDIGADILLAFDECTPYHVDRAYTEASLHRSHRWEQRSYERFKQLEAQKDGRFLPQALYGIVQGGVYDDLRQESCHFVNDTPFFGQAVGGCLGATKGQMQDVVACAMSHLRQDRPTHLLGIGKITDIFHGVSVGIDTFDCVHPTRLARHGSALVRWAERARFNKDATREHINLLNSVFQDDTAPLDPLCSCATCQNYSRGYLHHLLKSREMVACLLLARHNVFFMNNLMSEIRRGLRYNCLEDVRTTWLGES